MQKAVEEYLKDCGCLVVRQSAEPAPITFESLVDGFLVHVLRLDPDCIPAQGEEYVRKPGRPRIPKKVIGWLIRRQIA
jgi:hypothetical protein